MMLIIMYQWISYLHELNKLCNLYPLVLPLTAGSCCLEFIYLTTLESTCTTTQLYSKLEQSINQTMSTTN